MVKRVAFSALILALAPAGVIAQVADPATQEAVAEPDMALRALADSCAAHKFETTVVVRPGRGSKVKICGEPGQTDAQWLVTLKDSVTKTEANEELAPGVREQIVTALKLEIARLESAAKAAAAPPVAGPVAAIKLPSTPVAPAERAPEYSTLPPLPAPKRPAPVKLAGGGPGAAAAAAAPAEPLVRPNVTVRCALPRETFGSCASLRRETQLMVRAGEDIASGTALRFVRGGDARAEIDLGTLKKGDVLREQLPGRVCSGVLRGKVQVQVLTKGRVAETLGPYSLYCGS